MKAILITAALFGLMPALSHAAAAPVPVSSLNATVDQTVLDLSAQKWKWMSDRNVETLDDLFDPKAVFVHMGGTMTKSQELEVISSGGIQYKRADVESVSVQVIGDTAIVLSKLTLLAVVGGNEVSNPFFVTEAYVKQGDSWKLAALSFTRRLGA